MFNWINKVIKRKKHKKETNEDSTICFRDGKTRCDLEWECAFCDHLLFLVDQQTKEHIKSLDISKSYEKLNPNNCPVREKDGDGNFIGICEYYLENNHTTCPVHGVVKEGGNKS